MSYIVKTLSLMYVPARVIVVALCVCVCVCVCVCLWPQYIEVTMATGGGGGARRQLQLPGGDGEDEEEVEDEEETDGVTAEELVQQYMERVSQCIQQLSLSLSLSLSHTHTHTHTHTLSLSLKLHKLLELKELRDFASLLKQYRDNLPVNQFLTRLKQLYGAQRSFLIPGHMTIT